MWQLYNQLVCTKLTKPNRGRHDLYGEPTRQDGETPIHIACSHGHLKLVEMLLECGANIEGKDQDVSVSSLLSSSLFSCWHVFTNASMLLLRAWARDGGGVGRPHRKAKRLCKLRATRVMWTLWRCCYSTALMSRPNQTSVSTSSRI